MDNQLKSLVSQNPRFFSTVNRAIVSAYEKTKEILSHLMLEPEVLKKRFGTVLPTVVDSTVVQLLATEGFEDAEVRFVQNCNSSAVHLEVRIGKCAFTFSKVSSRSATPRKAHFRDPYISQCFMPEVLPHFLPFTKDCTAFYVITYVTGADLLPQYIRVGRLNVDQQSWLCHHPIETLMSDTTELIRRTATPSVQEEVITLNRIIRKKNV